MNVILAETAGFCFGVERAINLVHEQIDKADGKRKIYTRSEEHTSELQSRI